MKNISLLPIGSLVSLKKGTRKLMIIGVNQISSENKKIYEYSACLYPYGYLNSDELFMFNNDNIEKVYHLGFADKELEEYYEDVLWAMKKSGEKNE